MTQQIEQDVSAQATAESAAPAPADAPADSSPGDVPTPAGEEEQSRGGGDETDAGGVPEATALSDVDRLGEIEVKATVELGSAELLVRDLAALAPGSVVRLDRLVGEAADLTVNGRLFARGDVVVVEDNLGLRVTKLMEPAGKPSPES